MEMKRLTPLKPNRVSKQIAEQIKSLILEGDLKPGEKLPSEREMSKITGVGRLSIREGLRILESMGVVETLYGIHSGTYVTKINLQDLTERFSDILRLSNITIDHLTEARLEISLVSLKYFIERGNEEDIKALEACVKETEVMFESGIETREKNLHFYQLIAQGTKNPVFILLGNSLLDILRRFLSHFVSPPEHSKRVLENHWTILRYLKDKDFDKASWAMRDHLIYTGERLKSLVNKSLADGLESN